MLKGRFWAWSETVKEWWMMRAGMMREMGWQVDEEVNRDKTGAMINKCINLLYFLFHIHTDTCMLTVVKNCSLIIMRSSSSRLHHALHLDRLSVRLSVLCLCCLLNVPTHHCANMLFKLNGTDLRGQHIVRYTTKCVIPQQNTVRYL